MISSNLEYENKSNKILRLVVGVKNKYYLEG